MAKKTEMQGTGSSRENHCAALENPLVTFTRIIREQLLVSDQLEKIADDLPDQVDGIACAKIHARLPVLVEASWQIDREVIFPVLLRSGTAPRIADVTIARWRDERLTDQGYALEVCDLLNELLLKTSTTTANEAGYMLRGFFENLRRAAAFELEYLIPLVRPRLTEEDLVTMIRLLSQHRGIVSSACVSTRQALTNHWRP